MDNLKYDNCTLQEINDEIKKIKLNLNRAKSAKFRIELLQKNNPGFIEYINDSDIFKAKNEFYIKNNILSIESYKEEYETHMGYAYLYYIEINDITIECCDTMEDLHTSDSNICCYSKMCNDVENIDNEMKEKYNITIKDILLYLQYYCPVFYHIEKQLYDHNNIDHMCNKCNTEQNI